MSETCPNCLKIKEAVDILIDRENVKDAQIQQLQAENEQLKHALRELVIAQNCGSFPKRQCVANRGRILLEALKEII